MKELKLTREEIIKMSELLYRFKIMVEKELGDDYDCEQIQSTIDIIDNYLK